MRWGELGLVVLLAVCAPPEARADEGAFQESRRVVDEFMAELKAELQEALRAEGPAAAVAVCSDKAPAIAARHAAQVGGRVGRTSLRWRNPDNAPSDWQASVLRGFEERQRAGEDARQLEYHAVVARDGQAWFRYMKAIPTQGVCLTCHGSELAPEVRAQLERLYPDDRATGFAVGDVRGAFVVELPR